MRSASVRFRVVIILVVFFLLSIPTGAFCGDSVLLVTVEEAA